MASSPDQRRTGFGKRMLVQVNTESILLEDQWQPAHGRILISTTDQLGAEYFSGRMIQVDGVLAPPETASSPGLFDYRKNLYRRGIHHELRTDEFSHWKLLPQPDVPTRPLADVFRNWARHNFRKGLPEQDEALELLWAMSLGWRTALTGDVAAPFMQSGTMHLFAISGLHIALVAGILVALLRVTRLPRSWAGGVAIPLLWFYTAATGWQPSAVRASVMMTLILGAWALKRPVNILNSLGAAAFLILLWDPQQLFRASFQLSFVVVFSLALVMPPVVEWLQVRVRPDPYLPRQLWPRWRRWILEPSYWLVGALSVSFSAWLASAPLVAHQFHLFNPVALLANVPVVLCGILALASCMASLLCGGWLEPITILFNHSAWFFMRCMMGLSEWAASLPNAWQYVRSPEPWMMAGWYALLFGVGTGWFLRPQIRRWAMGDGGRHRFHNRLDCELANRSADGFSHFSAQ
jgi:ComEC/Rec2-related protein